MRTIRHLVTAHPVATLALAILALFAVYSVIPEAVTHVSDIGLTALLSFAFCWAVWLLLRKTRTWTRRGLGLLGLVTGDALLYAILAGVGTVLSVQDVLLNLTRACLTVGVVLLLSGLLTARRDDVDDHRPELTMTKDGLP